MTPRSTNLLLIFIAIASSSFAQDSKYQQLSPFDNEKFQERFQENSAFDLDTLTLPQSKEILASNRHINPAVRWFEVDEEDMAPMPKTSFGSGDLKYHIQIKKYESQYPYPKSYEIGKLLENQDLKNPVKKP